MVLIVCSLAGWLVAVTLICLFVAGSSRGHATTVQPLLTDRRRPTRGRRRSTSSAAR
jgi:hypothetical protein